MTNGDKGEEVCNALQRVATAHGLALRRPIETDLERAEILMRESGLFTKDQLRDVNEARMWAVWKLGYLLQRRSVR